jgi:ribosomal protein S18 acetylase RimI-like enzyme
VIVDTGYRRRGIGVQLMKAVEEYAIKAGRSLLFLDTREGDNAEVLYRKMGFSETGKIPNYVRKTGGGFEATVVYYKILG